MLFCSGEVRLVTSSYALLAGWNMLDLVGEVLYLDDGTSFECEYRLRRRAGSKKIRRAAKGISRQTATDPFSKSTTQNLLDPVDGEKVR